MEKDGIIKIQNWPELQPYKFSVLMLVNSTRVCSAVSDSLQPQGLQAARLLCPWDFPGKNTGVGCHFLLQGIFPIQVSNPGFLCLLQWQADSLPLELPGKSTVNATKIKEFLKIP